MRELPKPTADLLVGLLLGVAGTCTVLSAARWLLPRTSSSPRPDRDDRHGFAGAIGNTPTLHLSSLSKELGVTVYAKAEFMNPGGSSKDRVALAAVEAAEREGRLVRGRGDRVYEGTVGSTGISLALVCKAMGYECHIVMPDDQAAEKYALLGSLSAVVEKVRPAPIADPRHFVNIARRRAAQTAAEAEGSGGPSAVFVDQFENPCNWRIHYSSTGPEIADFVSSAAPGRPISMFVMAAGTGGTLTGVSGYLKTGHSRDMVSVLSDPPGSGLYHKVKHGIMFAGDFEREGTRRRHQVDTLVEGVGINRLTRNLATGLERGWIDDAVRVSDAECVRMARYMVEKEGLFLGSSSCVNLVGVVKAVKERGWCGEADRIVVTVLCDGGQRHLTKFWSDTWLGSWFGEGDGSWQRPVKTVWDVLD